MDYEIVLRPLSEEDGGGWAAIVPDLPGCMGDGETPEEALRDVEDAIKSWIETAKALGREIPKPSRRTEYSGKFTLRVPKSLHEALDKRAKDDGVSLNQTCIHLLSLGLGTTRAPKRQSVMTTPTLLSYAAPSVDKGNEVVWVDSRHQPEDIVVVDLNGTQVAFDVKGRVNPRYVGYATSQDGHTVAFNPSTGQPFPVRKAQVRWTRGHAPSKS